MVLLDLQDAFLLIPILPESRKSWGPVSEPNFSVLGSPLWSDFFPRIFTRAMARLSFFQDGLSSDRYPDDRLILASSWEDWLDEGCPSSSPLLFAGLAARPSKEFSDSVSVWVLFGYDDLNISFEGFLSMDLLLNSSPNWKNSGLLALISLPV